jgi:hypothetical protein
MDRINHFIYQLKGYMIILLLLSFSSCSKEKKGPNNTSIYGKVLDYYTLEPISDVQVIMNDGLAATGFIILDPMSTNLTDTALTDKNGFFYVELNNHYYNAILGLEKDGYLSYKYILDDYHTPHSFPAGVYPNYDIRLKPIEDEKSH